MQLSRRMQDLGSETMYCVLCIVMQVLYQFLQSADTVIDTSARASVLRGPLPTRESKQIRPAAEGRGLVFEIFEKWFCDFARSRPPNGPTPSNTTGTL